MTARKTWMKDLSPELIALGQQKAVEANAAWHASVESILTAAKAVYDVQAQIGGAPTGKFYAWVEEELQRSATTGAVLAAVGQRYEILWSAKESLPPALYTLYELVKTAYDDTVLRAVIAHVGPETTREEVRGILPQVRPPDPYDKVLALQGAASQLEHEVRAFLQPTSRLDEHMAEIVTDRDGIIHDATFESLCVTFVELRYRVEHCIHALRQRLNGAPGHWGQRSGLIEQLAREDVRPNDGPYERAAAQRRRRDLSRV